MKLSWIVLLWGCLTGEYEHTYSQCFQIYGEIKDSKTRETLTGAVISGFSNDGELISKSISQEDGFYRLENACKIDVVVVRFKGYYPLKIPVRTLNEPMPETTFYVPIGLSPVPAQTLGQAYDQHAQKHTELGKDTSSEGRFKRRFEVVDAETQALIPDAVIWLISTQTGKRELYETSQGHPALFSQTDIIALEVSAPGFDNFYGNIIITPKTEPFAVNTIRLNRRYAVLSVWGKGLETLQLTGLETPAPLTRQNEQYQHITTLPGRYSLQYAPSSRHIDSLSLSEGINLITLQPDRQNERIVPPRDSILVYFLQGDYKLSNGTLPVLDSLAAYLLTHPGQKVAITGHTDNIGNPNLNQTLSEFRAKVVYNYLINKRVNPKQITWTGAGIRYPVKPNDTEEHRKWNRRVVILYTGKS